MTGRWFGSAGRGPGRCLAVALVSAVVGAVIGSPALVIGAPVGAAGWWHQRRSAAASAGRGAATDRTIELVAELIQHLKGGRSLAQALRATASASAGAGAGATSAVGPDLVLARVRAAADAGAGLEAALARAATARGDDAGVGLLVRTLLVLVQRGGPALPALERLDDTLRSARWVEQETAAQASQATASALALAALPALFVSALALLDRSLARFYAFHPLGAACLVGAGLLAYAGWRWMQRIVTVSLRSPR